MYINKSCAYDVRVDLDCRVYTITGKVYVPFTLNTLITKHEPFYSYFYCARVNVTRTAFFPIRSDRAMIKHYNVKVATP